MKLSSPYIFGFLIAVTLVWAPTEQVQAQTTSKTVDQSATYVSQVDNQLTIRTLTVLPVTDNVEGIYARHIEAQLIELAKTAHRWDYVDFNNAATVPPLLDLEDKPSEVSKLGAKVNVDAFLAAAASRGPNGLSVRVDLFIRSDGKLISQELLRDHPRFEIPDLKEQVGKLYKKTLAHIPYDGIILSRQQNRVTINLGQSDHLKKDQMITAVQIISIKRHPKFNFILSSDKEILGRIRILKVDETLSFGEIVSEKERGAIAKLAKIAGVDPIEYPSQDSISDSGVAITDRADAAVSFGEKPREWLPVKPPAFGEIGLKLGFGQFSSTANLATAGSIEAKDSFYPSVSLSGELWLNPEWTVRTDVTQAVIKTNNPLPGSSPSALNQSLSRYSLSVGYNFLLQNDFFGPKFFVNSGFGYYRVSTADSTPRSLTTLNYSGLMLGLGGSFPVTAEREWYIGGSFNLYLFPNLSESPVSSGSSSKNSINEFSFFVQRKISENLLFVGSLDYALYLTDYSGTGTRAPEKATSLSQRHTVLNGGVIYRF
jgi:hypothetical protein